MLKKSNFLLFIAFIFLLFSCKNNTNITQLSTPCELGGEPNLFISSDGKALMSWVEYVNDSTDVLAFSTIEHKAWSAPKIIAKGSNWFVNWADFPSIVAYKENPKHLAAHWLQKSAVGTYDYDIRIAQSIDGGQKWQTSFIPHTDGIAAEHGFVTMLPVENSKIFAAWLDGRYTKTENNSDGHDHEGQGGAMTLRGAFFNQKGQLSGEIELDEKVCDCCSTSATLTENGVLVVYRDRTNQEIRDISIVRQVGQDWTRPRAIAKDNWEIAGCPVNGPKVVSDGGKKVAVTWYTMAQDTPKVQVVLSSDAGTSFTTPIRIDDGSPLGRVDLLFKEGNLIVSWLENLKGEKAAIRLAKISPDLKITQKFTLTQTSSSRSSGFPIMEVYNQQLLLAWTEVLDEEENTTIRSAIVDF